MNENKSSLGRNLLPTDPIGISVCLIKDDGTPFHTKTRSSIWNLCGTDVVLVDGIAGGYSVKRIFLHE